MPGRHWAEEDAQRRTLANEDPYADCWPPPDPFGSSFINGKRVGGPAPWDDDYIEPDPS